MLVIEDLEAKTETEPILKGLHLQVQAGEIHAIMGPNGAGKSTLAKVLGGHPAYEVVGGSVSFCKEDLLALEPAERAVKGLFMSFQYPVEIAGVTNRDFLCAAYKAQKGKELDDTHLMQKLAEIKMDASYLTRNLNEGFSGGEKKRNEILQMAILDPKLALLDETDSGLDIDALRIVADGVNRFMNAEKGLVLITHYQRLLDYIKPDFVHVMLEGKIVQSGGADLAHKLEAEGYDWLSS